MLQYQLTPNHAGVALWGEYSSLNRLRDFIVEVVEQSVIIEDKESFVLGLAYDLRKAFEGDRSKGVREETPEARCPIFGVEVLWPVLLLQVGLLREAMAFMPTSKLDQALMFELEHVVESAIREAMPVTANEVIGLTKRIGGMPYMHLDGALDSRCLYFIELPPELRLPMLPRLMATFDPLYDASPRNAKDAIPPDAFENCEREWPEFEW